LTELSRKAQCALLAATDLAAHYRPGALVSLGEMARRTGVSRKYLGQVLLLLKRRMLVHSFRGSKGGYRLMRRPALISAAEVIAAASPGRRAARAAALQQPYAGALDWLAQKMADAGRAVLTDITLADLADRVGWQP